AGSAGSKPTITFNTCAASATVCTNGPAASWLSQTGIRPPRLTRPRVGRNPTSACADAGDRMELTVSVPSPTRPYPAANAAPVPPHDPPGVRVMSEWLRVWPPIDILPALNGGDSHSTDASQCALTCTQHLQLLHGLTPPVRRPKHCGRRLCHGRGLIHIPDTPTHAR